VGGFIVNSLGKVPSVDEKFVFDNLEMTVAAADSRKVESVRIRKINGEIQPGPAANESR
jgi:magnesium and cobalt transporter